MTDRQLPEVSDTEQLELVWMHKNRNFKNNYRLICESVYFE